MSEWDKITALIERYLDGELSDKERADFKRQLQSDPLLADELAFHRELRRGIMEAGTMHAIKKTVEEIHHEFKLKQKRRDKQALIKQINRKIYRSLAYAALFALLVSTAAVAIYHITFNHSQKKELYTKLKRMIRETRTLPVHTSLPGDTAAIDVKTTQKEDVEQYAATAFAVNDSGYLVTSYHVLKGAKQIEIESKGDSSATYTATLVSADENIDIALLKINDALFKGWPAPLPFVFSKQEAILGEKVYTIGYPRDDVIFGEGSVSAQTGYREDTLAYQISIPVNPGNSGAPLINEKGEISGIITAKNSGAEGVSFAIKSKYFLQFLDSVNKDTSLAPIDLPKRNKIRWMKRTAQIEKLRDYVFMLKATCWK